MKLLIMREATGSDRHMGQKQDQLGIHCARSRIIVIVAVDWHNAGEIVFNCTFVKSFAEVLEIEKLYVNLHMDANKKCIKIITFSYSSFFKPQL